MYVRISLMVMFRLAKTKQNKNGGKQDTIVKRMNIWYTYTMQDYSAVKTNELQLHATIWVNLENITLHGKIKPYKTEGV